jgi:uncharacterized membrane protein
MVPTIEARFAIPLGVIQYKLNPLLTFFFAIIGTTLATIFVLIFLYYIVPKIKLKKLEKIMNKIFEHTRKKHSKKLESFKETTIITFVAAPFPGTGIYTGSIICHLMGIPFKKALVLNTIGMLISATITLLSALGIVAIV